MCTRFPSRFLCPAGCTVVEVEGAFMIGTVAAINYLLSARLLEILHIDDMVRAQQLLCEDTPIYMHNVETELFQ